MTARDPKRDPRPGDVVCVGFDCRTVIDITPAGAIRYRGDRHHGICSRTMWRVWCRGIAALQERDMTIHRNSATTWTEDRLAKLRDLMARGLTYGEIGDYFGVTAKAIQATCVRYGLPPRKGGRPKRERAVVMVPASARPSVMESSIPWPSKQQMMGSHARVAKVAR